ncbi:MAG TPA: VOC family protein [Candidatus Binatia bacterium]|nr:VOC family protein [Candidatus Binatia bacterium]
MVKTQGVVHFSLPVTDLERSARFYSGLLGMKIVQKTPRMVFLKCGSDYLILAKDSPVKYDSLEQTPVHHAFKVAAEDFEPAVEFLKQSGVNIFHIEDRRDGVFFGRQAYFLDPDGNKLEIHDSQGMGV